MLQRVPTVVLGGALATAVAMLALVPTARASLFSFLGSTANTAAGTYEFTDEQTSQTISLLRATRNVDPTPARGGGGIQSVDGALLAESTPFLGDATDKERPAAPDQISLYLVQEGDTLSQVAEMFNVSVNTIVWANELKGGHDIHPGDTLLILPVSGVRHTIVEGDTLKSIAKKYEGDADEIVTYNGLTEGAPLAVGSVVTIPGGEVPQPKAAPRAQSSGTVITSGPSVAGYFIHPVPGSTKTQGLHGYNALDFGAPYGTPIRAAANGRIIVSRVGGWNGGYGNYIVIDHPNGTQTLYSHNSRNVVWQGQSVVQGQVIGYVGSTGRSTGNHLHFEVRGARNPF